MIDDSSGTAGSPDTRDVRVAPCALFHRASELSELMEEPDCDPEKLRRTYRQLAAINRIFAQWRRTYTAYIRPRLGGAPRPATLLDIGFGGGDLPLALHRWARADGFDLRVTAIDPDERALAFVAELSVPQGVEFRCASSRDLVAEGACFDFVVSNHLLHHLTPEETHRILADAEKLSNGLVLFSDILRSLLAYVVFPLITAPFFHDSFILHDGMVSIRRSYTAPELRRAVPDGWEVRTMFPSRLLLLRRS